MLYIPNSYIEYISFAFVVLLILLGVLLVILLVIILCSEPRDPKKTSTKPKPKSGGEPEPLKHSDGSDCPPHNFQFYQNADIVSIRKGDLPSFCWRCLDNSKCHVIYRCTKCGHRACGLHKTSNN